MCVKLESGLVDYTHCTWTVGHLLVPVLKLVHVLNLVPVLKLVPSHVCRNVLIRVRVRVRVRDKIRDRVRA